MYCTFNEKTLTLISRNTYAYKSIISRSLSLGEGHFCQFHTTHIVHINTLIIEGINFSSIAGCI
ncbi:hypothetical protein I7I53_03511 [Histoplasma capsulatum var. duboisii H88]|uniref:Uncharacterized protein n=1 Tax=Ajellomyces capsulatus (strain H88) TaxID=544711 RepID=A0A8A1LU27_AJEC8|nr:hypothetical protein I7I53_03511 [Histoplasma capsulatum var. duboisii H88]